MTEEYTNDEIALAFWRLFGEKINELRAANSELDSLMHETTQGPQHEMKELDAERHIRRASDDVIILGLVMERAKAGRLVTPQK